MDGGVLVAVNEQAIIAAIQLNIKLDKLISPYFKSEAEKIQWHQSEAYRLSEKLMGGPCGTFSVKTNNS